MSMVYCFECDEHVDSDYLEECPVCERSIDEILEDEHENFGNEEENLND